MLYIRRRDNHVRPVQCCRLRRLEAFLKLGFRSLMRLKASDTGGIWPYEKRLTPRYFIPPQSGPMGVLKRLLRYIDAKQPGRLQVAALSDE